MRTIYCSSCGAATERKLNYCNRCGANLAPAIQTPVSKLLGLAWAIPLAIALITLGGLGMVAFIGYEMVKRGAEVSTITAILLLADVLIIALIDWMLLRRLSHVIEVCSPVTRGPDTVRNELKGANLSQLEAHREPVSSVTERTTRTFQASTKS